MNANPEILADALRTADVLRKANSLCPVIVLDEDQGDAGDFLPRSTVEFATLVPSTFATVAYPSGAFEAYRFARPPDDALSAIREVEAMTARPVHPAGVAREEARWTRPAGEAGAKARRAPRVIETVTVVHDERVGEQLIAELYERAGLGRQAG